MGDRSGRRSREGEGTVASEAYFAVNVAAARIFSAAERVYSYGRLCSAEDMRL